MDLTEYVDTVIDGKYRIERLLGKGGMGAVFLARHLGTSRSVALKLIIPKYGADPTFLERFRREALAAGRLRHPNIVDVTDFGVARTGDVEVAYLVMEYLDGCSLEDVLEEETQLPLRWVIDFVEQFALAMDDAHRHGIVHRDLKPSNLWLEPNMRGGYTLKVLDFGLARMVGAPTEALPAKAGIAVTAEDGAETFVNQTRALPSSDGPGDPASSDLTRAGTIMGTPQYMSPEQCEGEPAGPASDLYSMGVILYRMLAGELPIKGRNAADTIRRHLLSAPPVLSDVAPSIPSRVSTVVMSALAKSAAERPTSARLFAEQFRSAAESLAGLVQRSLVFCFEHFATFLRLTFAFQLPVMALTFLALGIDLLVRMRAWPTDSLTWVRPSVWMTELFATVVASILLRGVSALAMAQIIVAPLRSVRLQVAYGAIRRVAGRVLAGALFLLLLVSAPVALAYSLALRAQASFIAVIGSPAGQATATQILEHVLTATATLALMAFALWIWIELFQLANIIVAEGLSLRTAIVRSRKLARRVLRETIALGTATLLLPLLVLLIFMLLRQIAVGPITLALVTIGGVTVRLFAGTVLTVISGMLYLKARQAAAEPIDELLTAQFVSELPPATAWERRLDVTPIRSGSTPSSVSRDDATRSM